MSQAKGKKEKQKKNPKTKQKKEKKTPKTKQNKKKRKEYTNLMKIICSLPLLFMHFPNKHILSAEYLM